jgi:hypothetical protein
MTRTAAATVLYVLNADHNVHVRSDLSLCDCTRSRSRRLTLLRRTQQHHIAPLRHLTAASADHVDEATTALSNRTFAITPRLALARSEPGYPGGTGSATRHWKPAISSRRTFSWLKLSRRATEQQRPHIEILDATWRRPTNRCYPLRCKPSNSASATAIRHWYSSTGEATPQ